MIAALLQGTIPVEINDAGDGWALVTSLGRENLGQSYVGGQGYTGCKFTSVDPAELTSIAQFDETECEELNAWYAAIAETDRRADETRFVLDYFSAEDRAREEFIKFIHAHSVQRVNEQIEITPFLPQSLPV
jgi:hypothetical protein